YVPPPLCCDADWTSRRNAPSSREGHVLSRESCYLRFATIIWRLSVCVCCTEQNAYLSGRSQDRNDTRNGSDNSFPFPKASNQPWLAVLENNLEFPAMFDKLRISLLLSAS